MILVTGGSGFIGSPREHELRPGGTSSCGISCSPWSRHGRGRRLPRSRGVMRCSPRCGRMSCSRSRRGTASVFTRPGAIMADDDRVVAADQQAFTHRYIVKYPARAPR